MPDKRQVMSLASVFARHYTGKTIGEIVELTHGIQRTALKLQNLAVKDCNQGLTDADEKNRERWRNHITTRLPDLKVSFSGDPRGCVVKVHVPGFPGDSWDEGAPWCVF